MSGERAGRERDGALVFMSRLLGQPGFIILGSLSLEILQLFCYQKFILFDNHDLCGGFVMPSSYVIGSHFEGYIKRLIESGRYTNASEVVREALRLMEEREELREAQIQYLRARIQEGIDGGPGIPADEVFDRLEAKYKKLTSSF